MNNIKSETLSLPINNLFGGIDYCIVDWFLLIYTSYFQYVSTNPLVSMNF